MLFFRWKRGKVQHPISPRNFPQLLKIHTFSTRWGKQGSELARADYISVIIVNLMAVFSQIGSIIINISRILRAAHIFDRYYWPIVQAITGFVFKHMRAILNFRLWAFHTKQGKVHFLKAITNYLSFFIFKMLDCAKSVIYLHCGQMLSKINKRTSWNFMCYSGLGEPHIMGVKESGKISGLAIVGHVVWIQMKSNALPILPCQESPRHPTNYFGLSWPSYELG